MRIGIVGGGFMGEAFLGGVLRAGVATPDQVTVAEVFAERRDVLAEHGVHVTDDSAAAASEADLILLAVKPQDFPTMAEALAGKIPAQAVVVSIAAGIALADIAEHTRHAACVRVMPNLPATIGAGAATYYVAAPVTPAQRAHVVAVLDAVAITAIEVFDDESVDLSTAVHGSGPAYAYIVMEAMIDSAVRLGMPQADATPLVLATLSGAARYAIESGTSPAELREAVTSKGGTTEAALARLEAAGLRTMFDDAIEAAFDRAKELAEGGS